VAYTPFRSMKEGERSAGKLAVGREVKVAADAESVVAFERPSTTEG